MDQEAENDVGEVEKKTLYLRTSLEQCTFLCVIISIHDLTAFSFVLLQYNLEVRLLD